MKKGKSATFHPLAGGLIGGAVIPAAAVLFMILSAAVIAGMDDPASYVLVCACVSVGLGGLIGGFTAVKLTGVLIGGVYSAVSALIIMAGISVFVPETQGILSRVLPPIILAVSPLLGGYVGLGKKQTQADMVKRARKLKR